MNEDDAYTHKAYATHRKRKGKIVWEKSKDMGDARFEVPPLPDKLKHLEPYLPELLKILRCHVDLDATPIGGFDGYVRVLPLDINPNALKPKPPQRPSSNQTAGSDEEEF